MSTNSIKPLQIGFPTSYAGIQNSFNILPESLNCAKVNDCEPKTSSQNIVYMAPEASYSNTVCIDSMSIADGNYNAPNSRQIFHDNQISLIQDQFYPPVNTANISIDYSNIITATNYQNQTQSYPYDSTLMSTAYNNQYTSQHNSTLPLYYSSSTSHRVIHHDSSDDEDYSDDPSDYESDNRMIRMSNGEYSHEDYYDEDEDFIYYKTHDGRKYKQAL